MTEQIARLSLAILLLFSVSSFAACTEDDHATDVTEIAGEDGNNGIQQLVMKHLDVSTENN